MNQLATIIESTDAFNVETKNHKQVWIMAAEQDKRLVFISHASANFSLADEIRALLEDRGIPCWIAPRDILGTRAYFEEIVHGIKECAVTLLLLTDEANQSEAVAREIERSFAYQKPILPLRLKRIKPSAKLEFIVASCQWVDAFDTPLKRRIEQVVNIVRAVEQGTPPPAPAPEQKTWSGSLERSLEQSLRHKMLSSVVAFLLLAMIGLASWSGIQGRVQDVKVDTSDIRKKIDQIQLDGEKQKKDDATFLAEMQRQSDERMKKIEQESDEQMKKIEQDRLESPKSFGSIYAYGTSTIPYLGQPTPWLLRLKLTLSDRSWKDAEVVVIGRPENAKPWQINLSQFIKTAKVSGAQDIEGGVNAEPGDITVCVTAFDSLRNQRMTLSASYEAIIKKKYLKDLSSERNDQSVQQLNLTPSPSPNCSDAGATKAVFVLDQDVHRPSAR
jgi:hypothetical protein